MKPVDRSEILPLGEYEKIRDHFRGRVIAEKRIRRVRLGDRMSGVFENHDTVLLQIQEMLRTERITRDEAIAHEIATYNELVPADGELSATFMVEIEDADAREAFLRDARGLDATLAIVTADGETSPAHLAKGRELPDRLSAVLYVKFALGPSARAVLRAVRAGTTAPRDAGLAVVVAHAAYTARAALAPEMVASLAGDVDGAI